MIVNKNNGICQFDVVSGWRIAQIRLCNGRIRKEFRLKILYCILIVILFAIPTHASTVRTYDVKSDSCGYVHQPMGSFIEEGDIWVGDPVLQCPKRGWIDFEYDGFFANGDYTIEKVEIVLNVKDAASSGSSFIFTSYFDDIYDLNNPFAVGDTSFTESTITAHDLWNIITANQILAITTAGMPLGEFRMEFGSYNFLNYDRGTIPIGIYEDGDDGDEVYFWGTGDLAPRLEVTYSERGSSPSPDISAIFSLLLLDEVAQNAQPIQDSRKLAATYKKSGHITVDGKLYGWGGRDEFLSPYTATD